MRRQTLSFILAFMFILGALPAPVQAAPGIQFNVEVQHSGVGAGATAVVTITAFSTDPTDPIVQLSCDPGGVRVGQNRCQVVLTNNEIVHFMAQTSKGFAFGGDEMVCSLDKAAPQMPANLMATDLTGLSITNVWTNKNDPNFGWPAIVDEMTTCPDGSTVPGSGTFGYQVYFGTDANGGASAGSATTQVNTPNFDPAAVTSSGTHYLRARVQDRAGNNSSWKTIYTFRLDTLLPVISGSVNPAPDGLNGWFVGVSPAIMVQVQDLFNNIVSMQARLNGGSYGPISNLKLEGEGIFTIDFQAIDSAENVGTSTTVVKIDKTPINHQLVKPWKSGSPNIVFPAWYNQDLTLFDKNTITRQVNDVSGVGSVQFKQPDGTWTEVPPSFTASGKYSVEVKTTDVAGNISTGMVAIQLDKDGPVNQASLDTTNLMKTKTARLKIKASDPLAGIASVSYQIDLLAVKPITTVNLDGEFVQDIDLSGLNPGTYSIKAIVTDQAGNITTQTFEVSTVVHSMFLPAVVR